MHGKYILIIFEFPFFLTIYGAEKLFNLWDGILSLRKWINDIQITSVLRCMVDKLWVIISLYSFALMRKKAKKSSIWISITLKRRAWPNAAETSQNEIFTRFQNGKIMNEFRYHRCNMCVWLSGSHYIKS